MQPKNGRSNDSGLDTTQLFTPGDFILARDNHWTSNFIRFGQRLRFKGEDKKYAIWNHAALVETADGGLIEAIGTGVKRTHINGYENQVYAYVHIDVTDHDREQIVNFGRWALDQPYAWLTLVSITYTLLTGGKFSFALQGQSICSGLVAKALERGDAIFNKSAEHIMPADLARYYKVEVIRR
jgi:hypothetical protein